MGTALQLAERLDSHIFKLLFYKRIRRCDYILSLLVPANRQRGLAIALRANSAECLAAVQRSRPRYSPTSLIGRTSRRATSKNGMEWNAKRGVHGTKVISVS